VRLPIGIDLDGVVADFVGGWIKRMAAEYPEWKAPVEADITDWDFVDQTVFPNDWTTFWQWVKMEHLFDDLNAYPGAVGAINDISHYSDIVFITARPVWACEDTLRWLDREGLGRFTVCYNGSKTSIPCSAYIEDAPHFLAQYVAERPEAVTFRMVRPWNSMVDWTVPLYGWGPPTTRQILALALGKT
jgi:5'(3')-deoxyribonucleotidase